MRARACARVCMNGCSCVCACVCVRACVRVCVCMRACVRARVYVYVCVRLTASCSAIKSSDPRQLCSLKAAACWLDPWGPSGPRLPVFEQIDSLCLSTHPALAGLSGVCFGLLFAPVSDQQRGCIGEVVCLIVVVEGEGEG